MVGGVIALVLGIIGLVAWWDEFLWVLKGSIPVILILGGALAAYLGYEEMKDRKALEGETQGSAEPSPEEVEKYKAEVEQLKAKLKELEEQEKKEQEGGSEES